MLIKRSALRFFPLVLVFSFLSACSTEPVNPPAELNDIDPEVWPERLWSRSTGIGGDDRELEFQVLALNEDIVTVDADGRICLVEATTGKRGWRSDIDESIIGGLAGDSSTLYLSSYKGEFIAFDTETKKVRWRNQLSSEVLSPAGTDGQYVAVQSISDSITLFNAADGRKIWEYDQDTPLLSLRGTASPVIKDDKVITSFANGELFAFALGSGEVLWRYTIANASGRTELERLVDADGLPVIEGGVIYAAAYQGAIAAVDFRTGSEIWNKPLSTSSGISVDDNTVYATLDNGSVIALDKYDGDEKWQTEELSYRRLGAPKVISGFLVVDDFEGYVHVISLKDGKIVARIRPDSDGVMGDMIVRGDQLYVYTNDGDVISYRITSS